METKLFLQIFAACCCYFSRSFGVCPIKIIAVLSKIQCKNLCSNYVLKKWTTAVFAAAHMFYIVCRLKKASVSYLPRFQCCLIKTYPPTGILIVTIILHFYNNNGNAVNFISHK